MATSAQYAVLVTQAALRTQEFVRQWRANWRQATPLTRHLARLEDERLAVAEYAAMEAHRRLVVESNASRVAALTLADGQ